MEYGILGPLTVSRGGRELRLGGAKQRSVLAVLLLQANELVPTARIVDGLWGERPPATAVKAVQIQVSKLRKLLDEGAIETRPTGYLLRVEPGALDLERFEGLLERGREQLAAGDAKDAGGLLREALGLWRGSPLGEFTYETFARNEIGRLEELRLAALELRLEADLALGRHGEVVGELEGLVRDHPLRESFSRLLILALYRAGRQADALTAYRETRTALVDELGLDPSQALQQLEAQILRHDRALEPPAQRHEDSPRVAQPSGTVTLVFTDVEGSTRLLSELGRDAYREALGAHRRAVREAFGRYDGYEVDNDGDSFFYAFTTAAGAVSAVQEAMAALESGPIAIRAGIHTGEPALDPPKYVGLEVHTAARIMAVGHGGQVVLSQSTRDLLDDSRTLTDLGEHRLKDLSVPRRLYQLGTAEFPRLRTLHRTNLPVPATEFIGRARELQDVVERLRDGVRLLTLTGPGGTGKTRLALQAAAEAADDFGEGVWWVPLAALRDPALVLRQTAQTLGVIEQPDRPLEDVLAEILGGKRMLLLLDNAEHLLPAAAVAIAALRDLHGPRLIVTSRERLQVAGEHVYPVPQLSAPEGLDLFTARAVALDPSFQASPAVQELCDRLDNLPLALELAAARCAVLTPEQMIDRLGNRLDLLKGGRDADPRQQTLRATIAWSYELLAQDERDVFARFAVFAGGATLEAVEDVCGTDLETIASLVEKSLVRRDGERYWMLETIREYAEEQLEAAGEAGELRGRHAGYFLELAEQAEPEMWGLQQRIWFDRLDSEHDNLRAALTATLAASEADTATRLAAALEPFWETRGHVQEGWRWLTQVLAAETGVAKVSRAKALYAADRLAALTHMHQEEKPLLEEAVTLFAEAGEQRGHISSLSHLGIALDRLGEPDEARRRHEEAVSLAKALDDHWLLAMALNNLSCTLMEHGDYAAARPLAEESLALRRALGEKRGIAVSLGTVAELALAVGDGESALPLLEESLAILRELGHVEYEAWTTTELGLAWLYASDREQARLVLEQALGLCLELDRGHTEAEADCLSGLATLAGLDGDTERSARLFGAAEAAREAIGIVPSPCVRPIYERLLPEIAADANEQALAASWQKGRLQSPAEAAGLGVHDPH